MKTTGGRPVAFALVASRHSCSVATAVTQSAQFRPPPARWTTRRTRSASTSRRASRRPPRGGRRTRGSRATSGADHDPWNTDPTWNGVGLRQCDAGEHTASTGQRVTKVLADPHSQIAVERLEHDVDRLMSSRTRSSRFCLRADRDQERPTDQPEELDQRCKDAGCGRNGEQGLITVGDGRGQQDHKRREEHRGERERPPDQDEGCTALAEAPRTSNARVRRRMSG